MNFDNKGSFNIESNASNIASNFNPMNLGRLNLEENAIEDNLDEYIEKLSLEESRFKTEEDFQKFLESGMSFPESYSFMDNFWGAKASQLEEVDLDFNYPFVEVNIFQQHPQPFQEGVAQYKEGNLNEATLAFEAALQRDPESSDIWRWLGTTHAENDEDRMAIMAFQKALKCDPSNIEALLDAGVSYTNELVRDDALNHLQEWLNLQPEYETIPRIIEEQFAHDDNITKQKMVIEMFLLAAERNPSDADLHLVLGVLWNITKEYDRAEEAFKEALKYDPNNPSLWNKLGATQANSYRTNGSKDAVRAYRNAIDMKPNYVRAWANMGISYANQGMYDLAAKYYLKALSLNSKPDHLWSYLRLALNCMGRRDLAEIVSSKNVDLFRKEFTF